MKYIDLRKFRYDNGRLTQAELAEQLGVTQAQIAFIEGGKRTMSNELISILKQKYNNIDCYITDDIVEKDEKIKSTPKTSTDELVGYCGTDINELYLLRAKVEQMQDEILWLRGMVERLTSR